jgi:hypothetical protein
MGILTGSLIATKITTDFWWLGVIIGGVSAYLLCDIKAIILAVPKAWNHVSSWRLHENTKARIIVTLKFLANVLFVGVANLFLSTFCSQKLEIVGAVLPIIFNFFFFVAIVFFFLMVVALFDRNIEYNNYCRFWLKYANPLSMLTISPILATYYTVRFLWKKRTEIGKGIVWSVSCFGKFFKHLFILTYSDERLLCFVFASAGTITSYILNFDMLQILVFAVIGAVVGVLNYRLISLRFIIKMKAEV